MSTASGESDIWYTFSKYWWNINKYLLFIVFMLLILRFLFPGLVLTARHCLEKRNLETTDIHLMKGRSNRNPQPVALDKSTYQIIFHSNLNVDLVFIKLEEPIKFSHSVSPIALPKNSTNHPAQKEWVTAVGWGLTCKDPPACTVENVMPNLLQVIHLHFLE